MLRLWNAVKCAHLNAVGGILPCQKFSFNIRKLRRPFGLLQFFSEPNLVLKVFWKFQVNNMPISTLMTILWGSVIRYFLKKNNKNNKDKKLKTIKTNVKHSLFWTENPNFGPKNADLIENMLTIQIFLRFYERSYRFLVVYQKLAVKLYPIKS